MGKVHRSKNRKTIPIIILSYVNSSYGVCVSLSVYTFVSILLYIYIDMHIGRLRTTALGTATSWA